MTLKLIHTIYLINHKDSLVLKIGGDYKEIKVTELPIMDRYSTGSSLSKANIKNVLKTAKLIDKDSSTNDNTIIEKTEEVSLENVDEKIMTIDDFLDDFKVE